MLDIYRDASFIVYKIGYSSGRRAEIRRLNIGTY